MAAGEDPDDSPVLGDAGSQSHAMAGAEGLTAAEVAERRSKGLVNVVPRDPSRTLRQVIRANVLTRFNALLGGLLVVVLSTGEVADGLFAFVIAANSLIGIVQELRAKRTLDRLTVLNTARARVVRDGEVGDVDVEDVVLDDVLEVRAGDAVVVDGEVITAHGLEANESLLTGESEPLVKSPGDELLSGSAIAAGTGRYRATRIGSLSYSATLAEEARKFTLVTSQIRQGIDRIIAVVTWALVPTAVLLLVSQLLTHEGWRDSIRGAVAGVVAMVPEGLVLLTSVAFAVGVVRLGKRNALVQQLAAVETLARVDVLCLDKTGTLTTGEVVLAEVESLTDDELTADALAALAAADPDPNATLQAVRAGTVTPPGWPDTWVVTGSVAFSSSRKWSGAQFLEQGTWLFGAPEVLMEGLLDDEQVRAKVEAHAAAGRRVVMLARGSDLDGDGLPDVRVAEALVLLDDAVRADARETLGFFAAQDVAVKVISGDHPRTVGAVARRVGVDVGEPMDARRLSSEAGAFADEVSANDVFGRVTPQQKRSMVGALQARGHVVAMTGDGVNDVLALKDADVGIAMGSGSAASRAVAEIVLLDSSFASLPAVVGEGRRVINNIERVAALFVTKTVYAFLLAVLVGVARLPFPFLPRHLTLVGSLTIGIPAFFLALAPNPRRAEPDFLRRVGVFSVPCGVVAAVATFTAYAVARAAHVGTDVARTTATLTLLGVGLLVLARLARPLDGPKALLVTGMGLLFAAVLALPGGRSFFRLTLPPLWLWLVAATAVGAGGLLIEVGTRAAPGIARRWTARRRAG